MHKTFATVRKNNLPLKNPVISITEIAKIHAYTNVNSDLSSSKYLKPVLCDFPMQAIPKKPYLLVYFFPFNFFIASSYFADIKRGYSVNEMLKSFLILFSM